MSCRPDVQPSWCSAVLMSCRPDVLPSWCPAVLTSWHPAILTSCRPYVLPFWRPNVLTSCLSDVLPSWRSDVLTLRRPEVLTSCRSDVLPFCRPAVLTSWRLRQNYCNGNLGFHFSEFPMFRTKLLIVLGKIPYVCETEISIRYPEHPTRNFESSCIKRFTTSYKIFIEKFENKTFRDSFCISRKYVIYSSSSNRSKWPICWFINAIACFLTSKVYSEVHFVQENFGISAILTNFARKCQADVTAPPLPRRVIVLHN